MSNYDDPGICQKCGACNDMDIMDRIDYIDTEYSTKCKECNHEGYWVTGFFEPME
jgi:hypothetical protein